jgi:heme oxygenase
LSQAPEAIVPALRQSLYLPLDDLLFITRQYINADVSRSGIARLLKREGMSAYRWGVHYVIEGSQLGGAVLYERLHARLAPHRLRYLQGDAAGPGPRWRNFMQALRAGVRTPAEIADACAGACAAFDCILALHTGAPSRGDSP